MLRLNAENETKERSLITSERGNLGRADGPSSASINAEH
jgi:hypothetical protein